MENASKALIIAGAILLSISIIALGMFAFSSVSDSIPDEPLKDVEINQFNSKFDAYEGTNVSGSRVKSLLSTLRSHNLGEEDETRRVGLDFSGNSKTVKAEREAITTTNISDASTNVKTGKTYAISFTYDDNTGLISSITIAENTKSN